MDKLQEIIERYKRVVLEGIVTVADVQQSSVQSRTKPKAKSNVDVLSTLLDFSGIGTSGGGGGDDNNLPEHESELSTINFFSTENPIDQQFKNCDNILQPELAAPVAPIVLAPLTPSPPLPTKQQQSVLTPSTSMNSQRVTITTNGGGSGKLGNSLKEANDAVIDNSLDSLVSGLLQSSLNNKTIVSSETAPVTPTLLPTDHDDEEILNGGDSCGGVGDGINVDVEEDIKTASPPVIVKKEIKSLAEIQIDLDKITPSTDEPPRIIMNDPNGLKIVLNFAKDHPRSDVSVIVVSIINQSVEPVEKLQFDASVTKPCKLRLLEPSSSSLPGIKPFRPPVDDITQVLLIANPTNISGVNMVCILSYCVGDDPDPVRESIDVKNLPNLLE